MPNLLWNSIKAMYNNVTVIVQFLQIGPGIVHMTYNSIFGSTLLLITLTPQEPLLQKFSVLAYADWWIPALITKLTIRAYNIQVKL